MVLEVACRVPDPFGQEVVLVLIDPQIHETSRADDACSHLDRVVFIRTGESLQIDESPGAGLLSVAQTQRVVQEITGCNVFTDVVAGSDSQVTTLQIGEGCFGKLVQIAMVPDLENPLWHRDAVPPLIWELFEGHNQGPRSEEFQKLLSDLG